ncbi:FAD-dependent oxidoreductase [Streptomyces sp. NPDC006733]|uniref:FAD-dependent oxidoreductase n=1 Tax=Streptomyces sp. NPDC006733 TaxID=3155460 RepID=UPI0033F47C1D
MTIKRAAVVGAGGSGLAAAYDLRRDFDVTLYDAQSHLGGNAHTLDVTSLDGEQTTVDTGVFTFFDGVWPSLFDDLGIRAVPLPQSIPMMALRCAECGFSFGSPEDAEPGSPPRRPDVSATVWEHFLEDFQKLGQAIDADTAVTPEDLVKSEGFSRYFVEHLITPAIAAAYIISPQAARRCSVSPLFKILMSVNFMPGVPSTGWMYIPEGTRSYTQSLADELAAVRLGTEVQSVRRTGDEVLIRDAAGDVQRFDKAVLAVASDRALKILDTPTDAQSRVLSAFPYDYNRWMFHTDASLPHSDGVISYQMAACTGEAHINLPHNGPQRLNSPTQYLSTMTCGGGVPDPAQVLQTMDHGIVILTPQAVGAQRDLPLISDSTLAFAGAYFGDTGHDNALASGRNAARVLKGLQPCGGIRDLLTSAWEPWRE